MRGQSRRDAFHGTSAPHRELHIAESEKKFVLLIVYDPIASLAAYKQSGSCYCYPPVRLTRLFAFRRDAPSVTALWR
jgi:hypothetical protein